MRVLDAGCGLGGSAAWLALHRQAHVTGVTLVPDQVVRARAHAERMGVADRTEFRVGDFTATGLEAGTYDIVWCFEALCHAPDKSAFYREAARLLRPGGRIIIAEYIRARRPLAAPSEERLRRWVAGWAIPDLDTPEEHMEAAAEAGFSRLIMHDITRLTRRSLRRVCVTACALWPGHRLARRLGLRSEAHEGNIYGAIRQYPSLRRGDWFYSIIVGTR
jgi:cyclopropane fatty-acyl-phospholipid synthase-like methyltransferase